MVLSEKEEKYIVKIAKFLKEKDENIKFRISVSKAKTFDDCKAKYKFCYIDKLPRVSQDFHYFGSFMHLILELFHLKLIKDESLKNNWKEQLSISFDEAYKEFEDNITGEQYKRAQELTAQYQAILEEEGLPNVIGVEKKFMINLNNVLLLNGFIDRIQIDPDGVLHVADYKTTKDPKYLKDYFQLLTYCYAMMLEDSSIKRIRASFILLVHDFDYLTHEYTREEVFEVAEKFLEYYYKIQDEKLWRPNPQFLCRYCDYLKHCNKGIDFVKKSQKGREFLMKEGLLKGKTSNKLFVGIRKW